MNLDDVQKKKKKKKKKKIAFLLSDWKTVNNSREISPKN